MASDTVTQNCIKCSAEPRQGSTKWGANCWREYRANRKSKPEQTQTAQTEEVSDAGRSAVRPGPAGRHAAEVGKRYRRVLKEAEQTPEYWREQVVLLQEEVARLKKLLAAANEMRVTCD